MLSDRVDLLAGVWKSMFFSVFAGFEAGKKCNGFFCEPGSQGTKRELSFQPVTNLQETNQNMLEGINQVSGLKIYTNIRNAMYNVVRRHTLCGRKFF
jgi:hypothetical protein